MGLQNGGMEMINGGNLYRSDRVSDEYLLVNNCGYQATGILRSSWTHWKRQLVCPLMDLHWLPSEV